MQCPTTRQLEALAKVSDVAFDIHFDILRKHWKCKSHKTEMDCWKPKEPLFHGNICILLSAFHLDAQALVIEDKTATVFAPPPTPEFWTLKESKLPGRRLGKASSATLEPLAPIVPLLQPNSTIVNNIIDGSIFTAKSAYDATITAAQSESQVIGIPKRCASLITEYPAGEWIQHGLVDFLAYYANKYGDSQYNSYWPALTKERLGIDLYKTAPKNAAKAPVLNLDRDFT